MYTIREVDASDKAVRGLGWGEVESFIASESVADVPEVGELSQNSQFVFGETGRPHLPFQQVELGGLPIGAAHLYFKMALSGISAARDQERLRDLQKDP